jgi:hypothetical protein
MPVQVSMPGDMIDTAVIPHCKTDESHAPHKFTKMQSGLMTNVISPNNINFRVLYSSDFWTDTPSLCVMCFSRVKYDSENSLLTSSLVHSPFPLNAILHPDWLKKDPISSPSELN